MQLANALKNSVVLSIVHISTMGIALLEIPILARALGAQQYGILLYIQAITAIAATFVEFGFNISSARDIAQNSSNNNEVQNIISRTNSAKTTLYFLAALPLLVLIASQSNHINDFIFLYSASLMLLLGIGFSPFWYFLGKEKIGTPSIIELIIKTTSLLLIFIFINTPSDMAIALWIYAACSLSNTAIQFAIINKSFNALSFSTFNAALKILKRDRAVFLYRAPSSISSSISTSLLGLLSTPANVALFSPSEKILKAVHGLSTPIFQVFLTPVTQAVNKNRKKSISIGTKMVAISFLASTLGALFFYTFSNSIIETILGTGYPSAPAILEIAVWALPFKVATAAICILIAIPHRKEKISAQSIFVLLACLVVISPIFIGLYGAKGMAYSLVLSELIQFLFTVYLIYKKVMK